MIDLRLNDWLVDLATEGFDLSIRIGTLDDFALRAGQSWPFEISGAMRRPAVTGLFGESPTALRLSVPRGDGLGLCPSFAIAQDIATGRVEQILAGVPSGTLGIPAVFNQARHLPARTSASLDDLDTYFRTPPWQD